MYTVYTTFGFCWFLVSGGMLMINYLSGVPTIGLSEYQIEVWWVRRGRYMTVFTISMFCSMIGILFSFTL